MSARSPSARWNAEHGGNGRQRRAGYPGKIAHHTRISAWVHAARLVLRDLRRGCRIHLREPYPCRWGPDFRDGETYPVHWHVGQRPRAGDYGNQRIAPSARTPEISARPPDPPPR